MWSSNHIPGLLQVRQLAAKHALQRQAGRGFSTVSFLEVKDCSLCPSSCGLPCCAPLKLVVVLSHLKLMFSAACRRWRIGPLRPRRLTMAGQHCRYTFTFSCSEMRFVWPRSVLQGNHCAQQCFTSGYPLWTLEALVGFCLSGGRHLCVPLCACPAGNHVISNRFIVRVLCNLPDASEHAVTFSTIKEVFSRFC